MTRIERALLRLMEPPASYAPDSRAKDYSVVALAIGFLAVLVLLCSVLPGAPS